MLKVTFLRNILILSLLIAISLPVYEVYFIQPSYRAMIIEQTEQEAIRFGNYLINSLGLDTYHLQRDKVPSEVAREVGVLRKDRQLTKLRIFSASGEIVYSTEPAEIGVVNENDYFTNIIAKGRAFSKVVEKHKLTADGDPTKIDVVETYVPIMGLAEFHGAIEIYYDISPAISALNRLTNRSNLMLIGIVLSLYVAIVLALRRTYASHCAQQESERLLAKSNEELEERVAERTKALQDANQFNRTVIDSMHDSVSIIDAESFKVIDYNSVFKKSLHVDESEIIGNTCFKLAHNIDTPCQEPEHNCPVSETVKTGKYVSYTHQNEGKDGEIRVVEVSTSPIFDESGRVHQVVLVKHDVTEREAAAKEIRQMAYYDPLTDLPNRRLLLDCLKKAAAQARRSQDKIALLFLDLDRFKEVNDTRGHSCGDQLLQAVAGRLRGLVRESDTLARLGGDEFVFLLTSIESELDAGVVAEKVLEAIREPIKLEEFQIHMTTSIGISIFPGDGEDSEELLKNADMALYEAKSNGRNLYKFFSAEMNERAQERHALENRMYKALADGDFSLVYQPQIDLNTMTIVGAEALARWNDPELGAISPGRFIPVAEESGLILQLGKWVLETACRQAKSWQGQGYEKFCVSVNISVRQFMQPDFVASVKEILAETKLPAELLELELTESLLMQNGEISAKILRQLKHLGIRLSIDDFGIGYSSLSYLKHFPIDRIKIDQGFVRDVNEDDNDRVIVETIIAMSEQMGLEVIAEGVETEAQRDALLLRNCYLIQGYLFARPMSPAELERFVVDAWPPADL